MAFMNSWHVQSQLVLYNGGNGDGFGIESFGVGEVDHYPVAFAGSDGDGFDIQTFGSFTTDQYPVLFAGHMGDGYDSKVFGQGLVFKFPTLFRGGEHDGFTTDNLGEGNWDQYPSLYAGGHGDGFDRGELDCILQVTITDDIGKGSLRWAVACALDGDTVSLMPNLSGDTIWVKDEILHLGKSVQFQGASIPHVTLATNTDLPFIEIQPGSQVIIEQVDFYSSVHDAAALQVIGDLILKEVNIEQVNHVDSIPIIQLAPNASMIILENVDFRKRQ